MAALITGLTTVMSKSLRELTQPAEVSRHIKFCGAVIGDLMTCCPELIYDPQSAENILPKLVDEFFANPQLSSTDSPVIPHLGALLRGLARLNYRSDNYILSTLANLFRVYFESAAMKQDFGDPRFLVFVEALQFSPGNERFSFSEPNFVSEANVFR